VRNPGHVEVWTSPPVTDERRRAELERLLSPDELGRLARFRVEPARVLYLSAHALLRLALSRLTGHAPEAWRFASDPRGKPTIDVPPADPPLHFSLTHTDGLVACAIASEPEVGIDAESVTRNGGFEGLARRFYSRDEQRLLAETPAERYRDTFLDLWTLKEAYLKARGLGLTVPTASVSFRPDPERSALVSFAPPIDDSPPAWRFLRLLVGDHRVALALRSERLDPELLDGAPLLQGR
jgi:4'-phosphopantetheinyl transferase